MIAATSNISRFVFSIVLSLVLFTPPAWAEMEDYPVVQLQSLDKITARTATFKATVGSTVKYGTLYIKVQACRKAPPIEKPESAAFLQVWEVTPSDEAKWVFSGWMFASSPGLSSMDHPVYDVWVIDCKKDETKADSDKEESEGDDAPEGDGDEDNVVAPDDPEE